MRRSLAADQHELIVRIEEPVVGVPSNPSRQAFARFRRHKPALVGAVVLILIALAVLIGPLLLSAISIPAMNWLLEKVTPACCWVASTLTAHGPVSDPHWVRSTLPGPSLLAMKW